MKISEFPITVIPLPMQHITEHNNAHYGFQAVAVSLTHSDCVGVVSPALCTGKAQLIWSQKHLITRVLEKSKKNRHFRFLGAS